MPKGDRSAATRASLLEAAERAFLRKGLYGATVREIVEEAGLTVPALYYHFDGVEELYTVLLEEGQGRFRQLVEGALAGTTDLRQRLLAIAKAYVEFGREAPLRLRLFCAELFRPHEPAEPDRGVEQVSAWVRSVIERVIAEGIARDELALDDARLGRRLFLGLLSGLLLEQARDPEIALLDDALAASAVQSFLDGTATRRGGA